MEAPLVSVLIPSYKAGALLSETLNSVKAQTYTHWEIVLVEDGVFDETSKVVNEFSNSTQQPVRHLEKERNEGVSLARNLAMKNAKGAIFAFLDADDVWDPNHLDSFVTFLREHDDWAAFCGARFIDTQSEFLGEQSAITSSMLGNMAESLYDYNFIQTASVAMIRRELYDQGLRFDPQISYGEDLDVWLWILSQGKTIGYTEQISVSYRKHDSSAMANTLRVNQKLGDFYQKHLHNPQISKKMRIMRFSLARYWTGRMLWRIEPKVAIRALTECLRVRPFKVKAWFFLILAQLVNIMASSS